MTINDLSFVPNLDLVLTSLLNSTIAFLPKAITAIVVFIATKLVAGSAEGIVTKALRAINLKRVIKSFDLGLSVSEEAEGGIIRILSLIARYTVLYIGIVFTLQVLGLSNIANFLLGLTVILPKLFSTLFILLLGIILAGFIESIVKRALISLDPATARLGGKIASYTVVSFFALMSLAELGLAATIINTLFIGMVASMSLAFALAVGLGAKDLVKTILERWYSNRKAPLRKK